MMTRLVPARLDSSRLSRRLLIGGAAAATCAAGVGALSLAAREEIVPPVSPAPVPLFDGNGDPPLLVDPGWLADRLAAPRPADRPLVIDLSPLRTHRAGHVPGAVHGWWQDTMDPYYDVYGVVLKSREAPFTHDEVLAALGIGDATDVVLYDSESNRYAARLVWYLRYLGHPRAAVLDGGLAAWRGTGGEVEGGERDTPAAPTATRDGQGGFIIGTRELAERLGDPALAILDTRTDAEADDDLNGTLRSGQIPGSIRVPWTATLRDEAGRLRSPEELNALLAAVGIVPEREVAVVARFGVETGQPWLVLKLLGYPAVRVYDQAWAEWGRKASDLPIEPLAPPAAG
jgi:thiosulfate/3-mercaptopyruvate sulfurtransferase